MKVDCIIFSLLSPIQMLSLVCNRMYSLRKGSKKRGSHADKIIEQKLQQQNIEQNICSG